MTSARSLESSYQHFAQRVLRSAKWKREPDLHRRPPGYEPSELPDRSIPHQSHEVGEALEWRVRRARVSGVRFEAERTLDRGRGIARPRAPLDLAALGVRGVPARRPGARAGLRR